MQFTAAGRYNGHLHMSKARYVRAISASLDRVWAELAASYFRFVACAGAARAMQCRVRVTLHCSPILQRRVCAAACWPPQPRLRHFERQRRCVLQLVSARCPALGQPVCAPRSALRRYGSEHVSARHAPAYPSAHFHGCLWLRISTHHAVTTPARSTSRGSARQGVACRV